MMIADCGLRIANLKSQISNFLTALDFACFAFSHSSSKVIYQQNPERSVNLKSQAMLFVLLILILGGSVFAQPPRKKNAPAPGAGPALISLEEAAKLEAVITTDLGAIRFEFLPDKAPKHVQAFIKNVQSGFYDGSAFHRVITRGLIQGGDPLLKDPKTPRARWGTGALNQLPDEFSDVKHLRGTVSTVRISGKANSGGAQFFICASTQSALDGQYSAFGQVTEGIEIVDQISLVEADGEQKTVNPVKIINIKVEPKREEPFKDAGVDEMRKEVILRTSLGDITISLDPDLAPDHVRNFLKLVQTGWYDHTAFHRVVPGFVVQGGMGQTRNGQKTHYADKWVRNLKPEFSPTRKHIRGVVSMARTDDPDSAQTSFFMMLAPAPSLDSKYTIFGKLVDGFDTLDRMEAVPRQGDGQTPVSRIELIEAVIKP
jgi:cyclophilin family peptidyl-prolyl cis-trans isomerase